jgi:predicted anti-sigma-YlaC factor YlaD
VTAPDPRALSNAELDARLHELQRRAFAVYDAAAEAAETAGDDAAYARAETEVAPLIAEAKLLSDERVRRLRVRVRVWRVAAVVVAVLGGGTVIWLMTHS